MTKNRHRWKRWIDDDGVRDLLGGISEALKRSWKLDKKHPRSFPLNTWWLFVQLEDQVENKPVQRTSVKRSAPPQPPQKLADLLYEDTIRSAYEDQNGGGYEDALKQAAKGYDEGYAAWRKILRALNASYMIRYYGIDFAPKPRVHFLHRRLLEIVDSKHLRGLNLEGIMEFFDDVCPCGNKHQADALRKLRKRWSRR